MLNNDLEFTAPLVEAYPASEQDLLAVRWLHLNSAVAVYKHGASDLGVGVLQREVPMTRGGTRKIRQFASDPDASETILNSESSLLVQSAYAEDIAGGRGLHDELP